MITASAFACPEVQSKNRAGVAVEPQSRTPQSKTQPSRNTESSAGVPTSGHIAI
jgi:hypothetical protein